MRTKADKAREYAAMIEQAAAYVAEANRYAGSLATLTACWRR